MWHKDGNKVGVRRNIGGSKDWVAEITIDGKFVRLGYFDKYEDAVKARIDAEKKYWGEYRYGEN